MLIDWQSSVFVNLLLCLPYDCYCAQWLFLYCVCVCVDHSCVSLFLWTLFIDDCVSLGLAVRSSSCMNLKRRPCSTRGCGVNRACSRVGSKSDIQWYSILPLFNCITDAACMQNRVFVTVGCPSVRLSLDLHQSLNSNNGGRRVCCLAAGPCCRRRCSTANAGSVMLRADEGGSTQTCLNVRSSGCRTLKESIIC